MLVDKRVGGGDSAVAFGLYRREIIPILPVGATLDSDMAGVHFHCRIPVERDRLVVIEGGGEVFEDDGQGHIGDGACRANDRRTIDKGVSAAMRVTGTTAYRVVLRGIRFGCMAVSVDGRIVGIICPVRIIIIFVAKGNGRLVIKRQRRPADDKARRTGLAAVTDVDLALGLQVDRGAGATIRSHRRGVVQVDGAGSKIHFVARGNGRAIVKRKRSVRERKRCIDNKRSGARYDEGRRMEIGGGHGSGVLQVHGLVVVGDRTTVDGTVHTGHALVDRQYYIIVEIDRTTDTSGGDRGRPITAGRDGVSLSKGGYRDQRHQKQDIDTTCHALRFRVLGCQVYYQGDASV